MPDHNFWRGRRVLLTGHTGFKGAWTWLWLEHLGAEIYGLSLPGDTTPNLSEILGLTHHKRSLLGDVRDPERVRAAVKMARPSVVLHMAAQALVRQSYRDPIETFDVNVRGTLQVLQELRSAEDLEACLVVTSDKVYENDDSSRIFTEEDRLGGSDPYSASKSACEIATAAFARSFFGAGHAGGKRARVVTARAGNVIGGGDWSQDRLVPDLWRALHAGTKIELRYPESTRPWQHVLEPISGYLEFIERLDQLGPTHAMNFGPDAGAPVTVREIVEQFQVAYGRSGQTGWTKAPGTHPKEAKTLSIDSSKARQLLSWKPRLSASEAIEWTANWYAAFDCGEDAATLTLDQISRYEQRAFTDFV